MPSRARYCTSSARTKWLLWARSHLGATTAASMRRRFLSCSPGRTTNARATARSSNQFGRTWSGRLSGSIVTETRMATASWNIRASLNTVWLIRDGKILTTRFSIRTAPQPKAASPYVRCKVTCMRQRARRASLQKFSAMLYDHESCQSRHRRSVAGSRKPFGAKIFRRTPLRSMVASSPAECERRTQGIVFSPVSPDRNRRASSRRLSQTKSRSPDGGSARWLQVRHATIPCPITMDRSGRTITL